MKNLYRYFDELLNVSIHKFIFITTLYGSFIDASTSALAFKLFGLSWYASHEQNVFAIQMASQFGVLGVTSLSFLREFFYFFIFVEFVSLFTLTNTNVFLHVKKKTKKLKERHRFISMLLICFVIVYATAPFSGATSNIIAIIEKLFNVVI